MHEGKIWWHPAFAAALKVELNDYEKSLTYYEEFPLSEKPLQIDIIVLKKHIGIVSDVRNRNGVPFIIHHANPYQKQYEEDILENREDIVGHFRIS